jgi:hypothetical protein
MDIWLDIPGYEGIYQSSNTGKIRTHKDKVSYTKKQGKRKWKQRKLKQKVGKDNCHRVSLWKEGKEKTFLVHRLVAMTFLDKPDGNDYINHIDGDRHNNHVDNLEWCDHKHNNNHAFDNGLMTTNREVILMDSKTNELKHFRSLAKASEYLGYNGGALSGYLIKGKKEARGHYIFTK